MKGRDVRYCLAASALLLTGCIRTRNYHPDLKDRPETQSTFYYQFRPDDKNYSGVCKPPDKCNEYFKRSEAHEAYVEFDARGSMYRDKENKPVQLKNTLDLIQQLKHPEGKPAQTIALYVFVHGWKNDASERSGNVWGFRRFLSYIASQHAGQPVLGVYIGWPGASLKGDVFLTFWNREPVADNVGNNEDLTNALRAILQAAKGPHYDEPGSSAVVIGHSFGGIVLERAATKLIREQLNIMSDRSSVVESPADLFLLLNEAGAAAIARPFLMDLADQHVVYEDDARHPHPLLLSMTSVGDVATKLAYPGGEYISFKRPVPEKYSPPDRFGQESTRPYDLLIAANMIALQSHQIVQYISEPSCDLKIELNPRNRKLTYCMNAVCQNRLNFTPYWIMQLPQIFVPDHSSVFQAHLLNLIAAVAEESEVTNYGPRAQKKEAARLTRGHPRLRRSQ